MNTPGERIKYLRNKKGFSQIQLAQILGKDNTTVSHWELDKVSLTKPRVKELCEFFNVSEAWLLHGMTCEPPKIQPNGHGKHHYTATHTDKYLLKRKSDGLYKGDSDWTDRISAARKFTESYAVLCNNYSGNKYEIIPEKSK